MISNDQELARHYKVTSKTVFDWRNKGLPCTAQGRGYVYDLDRTDEWVEAHRQETKLDEKSPAARVRLAKEKAKLRQERLKAAAMEREEKVAVGNILPREDWELFAVELIQQTRDRFMRLPKLLCKHVPQKFHRVLQAEGESEVRKICEQMARTVAEGPKE